MPSVGKRVTTPKKDSIVIQGSSGVSGSSKDLNKQQRIVAFLQSAKSVERDPLTDQSISEFEDQAAAALGSSVRAGSTSLHTNGLNVMANLTLVESDKKLSQTV